MEDGKKHWQPPPRPTELKNIHVVDLNKEKSGETDYFALISSKEKKPPTVQSSAPSKQIAATQAPKISEYVSTTASEAIPKDGPSHTFTRPLIILVTLSLIFVGTYFLIHSFSNKTVRLPASAQPTEATKQRIQPKYSTSGLLHARPRVTTNYPAMNRDTLGLEKPKIRVVAPNRMLPPQETSGVHQDNIETVPRTNEPPPPPPEPQQQMTSPEYNPTEQPPGQAPVPPPYPPPPPQPDPNAGVVQPPGFGG